MNQFNYETPFGTFENWEDAADRLRSCDMSETEIVVVERPATGSDTFSFDKTFASGALEGLTITGCLVHRCSVRPFQEGQYVRATWGSGDYVVTNVQKRN